MIQINSKPTQQGNPDVASGPDFYKTGRAFRITAEILVLVYICVQGFQAYVFGTFGAPANKEGELLLGAASLHIIYSFIMLLSMFALIVILWVICLRVCAFWAIQYPVSDAMYNEYYFVMVLAEYIPRSYWLFRVKEEYY